MASGDTGPWVEQTQSRSNIDQKILPEEVIEKHV